MPKEYLTSAPGSPDYRPRTPGILLHYGLALTVAQVIDVGKRVCIPGTPLEEIEWGYGLKVLTQMLPALKRLTGMDLKVERPCSYTFKWVLAVMNTLDPLETRLKQREACTHKARRKLAKMFGTQECFKWWWDHTSTDPKSVQCFLDLRLRNSTPECHLVLLVIFRYNTPPSRLHPHELEPKKLAKTDV